jgi:hypothetical protein
LDDDVSVLSEVDSDDDIADEDEDGNYPSTATTVNQDHRNWRGLEWCEDRKKFKVS